MPATCPTPPSSCRRSTAGGSTTVDLVAGGVPCQPFCRAGRSRIREPRRRTGERAAHDERADLWQSFIAVVEHLRPRAVLVENVPDLPRWDDGAVLIGFYESLARRSATTSTRASSTASATASRSTARGCSSSGCDGRPPAGLARAGRRSRSPLRDAIGDLPPVPPAQRARSLPYDAAPDQLRLPAPDAARTAGRGALASSTTTSPATSAPTTSRRSACSSEGQTYVDLPERLRRYRTDIFTDKYKRLAWDELCRSITAHIAKDGYWYIHPEQHRTLSIREAARVQTFPDGFRFAGDPDPPLPPDRQRRPAAARRGGRARRSAPRSQRPRSARPREQRRLPRPTCSTGTRDHRVGRPWRTGGSDPWLVLIGEMCLHAARRSRPGRAAMYRRAACGSRRPRARCVEDAEARGGGAARDRPRRRAAETAA